MEVALIRSYRVDALRLAASALSAFTSIAIKSPHGVTDLLGSYGGFEPKGLDSLRHTISPVLLAKASLPTVRMIFRPV